jgi:NADH-quinone oxidoreductase subunit C
MIEMNEILEALSRDMPEVLAPTAKPVLEATPAKRGEGPSPNLLATNDTVVYAQHIPVVAAYLRDTLGYELLTNITAVDYIADDLIEVVYHFARVQGGVPQALKVRLERNTPEVPSLTQLWPGADFQEREAFDLFGVIFTGHENLRRIYMWDEFEGFPMRKDFPKQGDKYFIEE